MWGGEDMERERAVEGLRCVEVADGEDAVERRGRGRESGGRWFLVYTY